MVLIWVSVDSIFFSRYTALLIFLILGEDNDENTTPDQTLFIRRIALRSDIPLKKKAWAPTHAPRTFMQQLRAILVPEDG